MKVSFLALYCLLLCHSLYSKVLIWDLGGVLVRESHFGMARDIGLRKFLAYTFLDHRTPFIQPLIFALLETFGTQRGDPSCRICTKDGHEVPLIMCDWFLGKKSGLDILELLHKRIEELDKDNYFISPRQKELVQETCKAMFDPNIVGHNIKPIKNGVKLLKECAAQKNRDGSKKHIFFVLSNWDPLSFDIVYRTHPEIFSYFQEKDILISGYIEHTKPHKECFEYVLNLIKERYKVEASECIFIDDQEINTQNAQACGIKALCLKNGDYARLRRQLKALKVL